jgi:hypothetical protein
LAATFSPRELLNGFDGGVHGALRLVRTLVNVLDDNVLLLELRVDGRRHFLERGKPLTHFEHHFVLLPGYHFLLPSRACKEGSIALRIGVR